MALRDTASAVVCLKEAVDWYGKGEFEYDLLDAYSRLVGILEETGDVSGRDEAAYMYWKTYGKIDAEDVYSQLYRYQNEALRSKEAEKIVERRGLIRMFVTIAVAALIIICLVILIYVVKNRLLLERKEKEIQYPRLLYESQEREIRSKNDMLEMKKVEQYRMDTFTGEIISRLNSLKSEVKDDSLKTQISGIQRDIEHEREQDSLENEWADMCRFSTVIFIRD